MRPAQAGRRPTGGLSAEQIVGNSPLLEPPARAPAPGRREESLIG